MTGAALVRAADQLAADNRDAQKLEEKRFDVYLTAYVTDSDRGIRRFQHGGMVGVVSTLATVAENLQCETTEGSEAEADYIFVADILDAVLHGVDLPYGERSGQSRRKTALAEMKKLIEEIKP